jgi:hypothetical protein
MKADSGGLELGVGVGIGQVCAYMPSCAAGSSTWWADAGARRCIAVAEHVGSGAEGRVGRRHHRDKGRQYCSGLGSTNEAAAQQKLLSFHLHRTGIQE